MQHPRARYAAALHYQQETGDPLWDHGAPTLVAKGDGDVADEILAVAREHGVPIHHDPALVGVLARLNLDDQIPQELFVAVAAVLGFIYDLQARQEPPVTD